MMKSTSTAFILTLFGFVGIAGLQYFYLGKYTKALLWFFTLGLLGLGTLIDVFTIGGQVRTFNIGVELETIRGDALNKKSK